VLLLDEPTAGLSTVETARVVEFIRALPRHSAMLIIEHDMDVAFQLADTLSVLHMGSVVVTGDPQIVRANDRVREIYLGEIAEKLTS
jgi:branched-chain amino acid transport system ATP-binding protein